MRPTPRHPLIRLIDEVVRLRGRLQSVFAEASAATGLAPMESTVLTAVVESRAAPTVSQIGRSLGHPRQVIQRATDNLVAARLLQTVPNPNHKRAMLLRVTPTGRRRYRDALAIGERTADSLARLLNRKECDRLARELHSVRARIEAYLRERS